MKIIWEYVKKYRKIIFLALILATINQVFSLLDPQITRILIDNYATKFDQIAPSDFMKGVLLLLLGYVGVALVSRIAKNFQDYFVNSITQHVGTDMYSDSVKHTFSLPFMVFEDRRSGEVLQKMLKAREQSQKLIESAINIVFLSAIGMIFVLAYAFGDPIYDSTCSRRSMRISMPSFVRAETITGRRSAKASFTCSASPFLSRSALLNT